MIQKLYTSTESFEKFFLSIQIKKFLKAENFCSKILRAGA